VHGGGGGGGGGGELRSSLEKISISMCLVLVFYFLISNTFVKKVCSFFLKKKKN
jgi:hypothetical protein